MLRPPDGFGDQDAGWHVLRHLGEEATVAPSVMHPDQGVVADPPRLRIGRIDLETGLAFGFAHPVPWPQAGGGGNPGKGGSWAGGGTRASSARAPRPPGCRLAPPAGRGPPVVVTRTPAFPTASQSRQQTDRQRAGSSPGSAPPTPRDPM